MTQKQLAEKAQVSTRTLRTWRDVEGLDITDETVVMTRAAQKRNPASADDESLAEAKRRRAVADADRAELLTAKERAKFVDARSAAGLIDLLLRSVQLSWRQLPKELPGRIEGMSPKDIVRTCEKIVDHEVIPRLLQLLESGCKDLNISKLDIDALNSHTSFHE